MRHFSPATIAMFLLGSVFISASCERKEISREKLERLRQEARQQEEQRIVELSSQLEDLRQRRDRALSTTDSIRKLTQYLESHLEDLRRSKQMLVNIVDERSRTDPSRGERRVPEAPSVELVLHYDDLFEIRLSEWKWGYTFGESRRQPRMLEPYTPEHVWRDVLFLRMIEHPERTFTDRDCTDLVVHYDRSPIEHFRFRAEGLADEPVTADVDFRAVTSQPHVFEEALRLCGITRDGGRFHRLFPGPPPRIERIQIVTRSTR
jgi:hypothetical protein